MIIRNAARLRQLAARAKSGISHLIHSTKSITYSSSRGARFSVLVVSAALVAAAFFSGPLASSYKFSRGNLSGKAKADKESPTRRLTHLTAKSGRNDMLSAAGSVSMFVDPEAIATYQSNDCATPKTSWDLGQTVCAKVTGATGPRRIAWYAPNGFIAQVSPVFAGTGSDQYTIPTGTDPFAQVGTWAVRVLNVDGDAVNVRDADGDHGNALFVIRDPNRATADLSLVTSIQTQSSSNISYTLTVYNLGPDSAQNVQLTDNATNATFVSATQDSGPSFSCSSNTCTGATLAANEKATFTFVFSLPSGTSLNTVTNTASATSDTSEPASQSSDNNSTIQFETGSTPPSACTLTCPANISQNNDPNQSGAVVNYTTPTGSSGCGTVTCDPPSGSFFPTGTTQVVCSGTGDSCSFNVTVNDPNGITITLNAPPGTCTDENGASGPCPATPLLAECHTSFTDPGATAKNGSGQTIPYTTQVVCEDENTGNTVPCSFNINRPGVYTYIYTATVGTESESISRTVFVVDTTPPVIALNGASTLTVECHTTFNDPVTATDSCAGSVSVITTGSVDVNTPGTYTLTYNASDSAGNDAAPVTRIVNVVDTTPPVITACATNKIFSTKGGTVQVSVPNLLGEVSATDSCAGAALVKTQSPAAGTLLGLGDTTVTITVKDAAGNSSTCAAVVTVLLFKVDEFVALGQEFVRLRANAKVYTGNVGANTSLPDSNGGADNQVEVEVGANAKMLQAGSFVAGDTMHLSGNSQVYNIHYNELNAPQASILGSQNTPVGLPMTILPALPVITPGTQDVTVAANQTMTLAAGSYRKITVSANATLTLTGGLYQVDSFDIRSNAKLYFTAAAELRVKTEINSDGNAIIGPAPSASTLLASQIVFYVEGADAGGGSGATPLAVDIGLNNTISANIYAPNGTVQLRANTVATGAFIGKRTEISDNVQLTLKSAF